MSTFNASPNAYAAPSNSLGIAGFICSLLGLLTAGVLSPVGLILSLIALGRQPRGFAIAGVVLGLLGTCGGVIVLVIFGAALLALIGIGMAAAFLALNDPQRMEITVDMANIEQAVERSRHETGYLPASLSSLGLSQDTLADPWGHPYSYHFTDAAAATAGSSGSVGGSGGGSGNASGTTSGSGGGTSSGGKRKDPGFDIVSAGADGKEGTTDDIMLSNLDEMWANYIKIESARGGAGKDASGNLRIKVGDKEINLEGGPDGGKVKIHTQDGRVIELSGDDQGGRITTTTTATMPAGQ